MRRLLIGALLLLVATAPRGECAAQGTRTSIPHDRALAGHIEQLVETFLTTDDDTKSESVLSEARAIFEREGIPRVATVGDAAAYRFVLINMLGQSPDFRGRFAAEVQKAAGRHTLPDDALVFAEARRRLTDIENRYSARTPSQPDLRDQIERLTKGDQAVREKEGFDVQKMAEADRKTTGPLTAIFERSGVPTYDMVGIQAARDFVVMVQHQSPAFRRNVLPKLKANVDAGQADPGMYAMVYDRTQRDQGKKQRYGEQLECSARKTLDLAPLEDSAGVNLRRATLGLMRLEIYTRLVRLHSPDLCGAAEARK